MTTNEDHGSELWKARKRLAAAQAEVDRLEQTANIMQVGKCYSYRPRCWPIGNDTAYCRVIGERVSDEGVRSVSVLRVVIGGWLSWSVAVEEFAPAVSDNDDEKEISESEFLAAVEELVGDIRRFSSQDRSA